MREGGSFLVSIARTCSGLGFGRLAGVVDAVIDKDLPGGSFCADEVTEPPSKDSAAVLVVFLLRLRLGTAGNSFWNNSEAILGPMPLSAIA